jgi:serine/threonine-protein kinase HipA
LQVLSVDVTPAIPTRIGAAPLIDSDVAAVLRGTISAAPSGSVFDLRVAIPGAQEKTALLCFDDKWWFPPP